MDGTPNGRCQLYVKQVSVSVAARLLYSTFFWLLFCVSLNFHFAYIDSHPKHPKPQKTLHQINVFGNQKTNFPPTIPDIPENDFCGLDWCVSSSKYPIPNFDLRTEHTQVMPAVGTKSCLPPPPKPPMPPKTPRNSRPYDRGSWPSTMAIIRPAISIPGRNVVALWGGGAQIPMKKLCIWPN